MVLARRMKARRRVVLSAAIAAALAVGIAVTPAANAADVPATSPARTGASSGPGLERGGGPGGPCTQPVCLFVRDKGRFKTIPYPFANVYLSHAINNRGEIAGTYNPDSAETTPNRGYLRDRGGRFIRIDVPGKAGTAAVDLNDRGQVVGNFCNVVPAVPCGPNRRGFLRESSGRFTTIHVPGALETQAFGINNRGQIVGQYLDNDGFIHGYQWDKGRLTTIDVPRAIGTSATDINDHGQIVGTYSNDGTTQRGFLLSGGVYARFKAPRVLFTYPTSINNRGQIAGFTATGPVIPEAEVHGFLRAWGIKGPLTPIDFPGAPRTLAWGLNDRSQIVGIYENPSAAPSAGRRGAEPPSAMPRLVSDPLEVGTRSPQ